MRVLTVSIFLAAVASANAASVLTNGNFEASPLGTGWVEATVGTPPMISNWAAATGGAVLTNSAFLGGYDNALDSITQTFNVPAGMVGGTLSFDLTRYTADTVGFDFLRVFVGGTQLASYDLGDANETAYLFSQPSITFTQAFADPTSTVRFEVTTNGSDASAAFIDNVSLEPTINVVPEPASLAVLGLGALGLLRRRRS
ncbi:MAG: hypothetical protein C4320_00745 [Armatimonadota bacterium]